MELDLFYYGGFNPLVQNFLGDSPTTCSVPVPAFFELKFIDFLISFQQG
jgi:hypothetical protein